MSEPATFSARLRYAITERGSGLRALHRATGLSYPAVRRYASGEAEPNVSSFVLLADALDVSMAWLAAGRGRMDGRAGEPGVMAASNARRAGNLAAMALSLDAVAARETLKKRRPA